MTTATAQGETRRRPSHRSRLGGVRGGGSRRRLVPVMATGTGSRRRGGVRVVDRVIESSTALRCGAPHHRAACRRSRLGGVRVIDRSLRAVAMGGRPVSRRVTRRRWRALPALESYTPGQDQAKSYVPVRTGTYWLPLAPDGGHCPACGGGGAAAAAGQCRVQLHVPLPRSWWSTVAQGGGGGGGGG